MQREESRVYDPPSFSFSFPFPAPGAVPESDDSLLGGPGVINPPPEGPDIEGRPLAVGDVAVGEVDAATEEAPPSPAAASVMRNSTHIRENDSVSSVLSSSCAFPAAGVCEVGLPQKEGVDDGDDAPFEFEPPLEPMRWSSAFSLSSSLHPSTL